MARPAPESFHVPEQFKICIDTFVAEQSIENCEYILVRKQKAITKFSLYLLEHGINSFDELNSMLILNYLREKTPETRSYIRSFLRYLFSNCLVAKDYSVSINIAKRPRKLPTVYSEEEIRTLVNVVDGDSLIAKRNKAIVLIAATTGMRSSDIVSLKYSDFCFEEKCIDIVQAKTGMPLSLPLNAETASAVMDYYASRPTSVTAGV